MLDSQQPPETDPDAHRRAAVALIWGRPVRFQTVAEAVAAYKRLAHLYLLAVSDGNTPASQLVEAWNDEVYASLPEYARQEVAAWVKDFLG